MQNLPWLSFLLFCTSIAGVLIPIALYPAAMAIVAMSARRRAAIEPDPWPSVSWVIVARNAEDLIGKKIQLALASDYPADRMDVVCFSDGSTDGTRAEMDAAAQEFPGQVTVLHSNDHAGKYTGLTEAARAARGDILVFSDADAATGAEALKALVRPFVDPEVGGVCGQRVISESEAGLTGAQSNYIAFDSLIKAGESRIGRLTSNDGKLYAIRANTFTPVPPGVTDDFFQALSVIGKGHKFVFAPEAVASIRTPSRSGGHEISRRRRIVGRSVGAMLKANGAHRRFGGDPFGLRLLLNKGLRRLLPLFLAGLFIASLFLATFHWLFALIALGQAAFWLAALGGFLLDKLPLPKKLKKLAALPHYILLGMVGTLLGVMDAMRGTTQDKWNPVKRDAPA